MDEFGVRYDGQGSHPHLHVVCLTCKRILDVEPLSLPTLLGEVEQVTGCTVTRHNLVVLRLLPRLPYPIRHHS
ncbi:MAG: hypothetical protein HC897_13155, partial [Thermoanaerobaculia bacterium]|nr:hypothetical protein [Thermoanaerobaculia bacterium]